MVRQERWRRQWDRNAGSYDRQIRLFERVLFGDSREWVCSRAAGEVLEVAIGTGRNLPAYPGTARLTGIDWSPAMLDIAQRRAAELRRPVRLMAGDAQDLPFPDASFDCVVSTFSMCAIPDDRRAIGEMARVLRPGGRLLLADHVASSAWPLWIMQWLVERATIPLAGEHFLRRPLTSLGAAGLEVELRERLTFGVLERVVARKPA